MQVYPKFSTKSDLINYLSEVSAQYENKFYLNLTNNEIIESMASTLDKNRALLDKPLVDYRNLLEDLMVESFTYQPYETTDDEMDDALNIFNTCVNHN